MTTLQSMVEDWIRTNKLTRGDAAARLRISYPVLLSILRGDDISLSTEWKVRQEMRRPDQREVIQTHYTLTELSLELEPGKYKDAVDKACKWLSEWLI